MQSYDPTEVTIVFAGQQIDGYGPGTFIKVSRNEDTWSFQPSLSGSGARSRNPNKSGRFEFTLLAASPSNAFLSSMIEADEFNGTGVGECQVKDRGTDDAKCAAQNAWVVKTADFERGKEVGEITWVIETDEVEIVHDGLIDA
jgi:hypothetical protein